MDEPAVVDAICVAAVGGADDQFIAERTNVFGPGEKAVRGTCKVVDVIGRKCSYCGAHFVEGWTVAVLDWGGT